MIRKLMILILILLIGYIFYGEFIADSIEPILRKVANHPLFYQVRDPKVVFEDPSQEFPGAAPGPQAHGAAQDKPASAQPPLEQPAAAGTAQGQTQ